LHAAEGRVAAPQLRPGPHFIRAGVQMGHIILLIKPGHDDNLASRILNARSFDYSKALGYAKAPKRILS
jgi:hypothetical protein